MHGPSRLLAFSLLLLLCCANTLLAQQPACAPPPPPVNKEPNIFNAQQEMEVGDAIAERVQKDFHVIDDDAVNDYLRGIGERIVRGLPPTGINFRFFVVDLPDANAFTLPGGRVYVTRKLIALARSEDELAGVIAHELGHGLMHHGAVDLTRIFREVLGVTQVTDRRDIFEKYNRLIENIQTKRTKIKDREESEQLEADRAGLFAMVAAGYDPQAFSAFWDRFVETKGKTGNWFSDLFGTTKPEQKRLREMLKAAQTIPAACITKRAANFKSDFEQWQSTVVVYSGTGRKEQLHGVLAKMILEPPLRGEIRHLRFSPDGRYILAQDDSGINVLAREPFALLYRIEAPEAKPAMFTPDAQSIVFYNSNLHVERWNLTDGTRTDAYEVVIKRRSCLQTQLSSDGKTLACYDSGFNLGLYDVATSEMIYQKEEFYIPQSFFEFLLVLLSSLRQNNELDVLNMQFSPDNHYFLAARNDKSRVVIRFNGMSAGGDNKVTLAVDIGTRKSVSLGGSIKSLMSGGFAFASPTTLIGEYYKDSDRSGIYSFPDGKKVEQFRLVGDDFVMANRGDFVVIRPIAQYPAGIYDVKTKKIIVGNRQAAIDVYGDTFVAERRNGELGLYDIVTSKNLFRIELPKNSLGRLRVAQVSPDLKWLAVSERSRGAVWDLTTGQRVFHIRGFRGAYFAEDGNIYADFPKFEKTQHTIALMMPAVQDVREGIPLSEGAVDQYGGYLISTFSNEKSEKSSGTKEKDEEKDDKKDKKKSAVEGLIFSSSDDNNTRMEARDVQRGSILWSRDFPDGSPEDYWGRPRHGTLTLSWKLSSKAARNIVKADPELSRQLSGMGDKEGDYLVQVLELKSGKLLGQLLIETGKGSFRVDDIITAGDWVAVSDTQNRVLVYSLRSGQLKQRFFGDHVAVSENDDLLCVENERGRLFVYDLNTGAKRDEFSFTSPVSLIQFVSGKRLFVLTANQTTYLLDVSPKAATTTATDSGPK